VKKAAILQGIHHPPRQISNDRSGMKLRHLLLIAKIALSVGLVWYVANKFDLRQALGQLRSMAPVWLLAIFSLYYLQLVAAALRLREFLGVMGAAVGLVRCIDAALIGYFFSQTFISFVGGDAMRIYRISQSGTSLATTMKAVVLDRASGFAGQVLLILLVLPFAIPRIEDPKMRLSLVVIVLAALFGALAMVLAAMLPHAWRRFKPVNALADVSARVLRRISTPKGAAAFFGYSLVINLLNIVIFYALAQGLSVSLTFLDCLVLLPPVFFISMLPISISGWGVREGAAILALGLAGVPATAALAISVSFGIGLILVSLPGGALFVLTRRRRPTLREASDAKN
jgi:hypothetical protein